MSRAKVRTDQVPFITSINKDMGKLDPRNSQVMREGIEDFEPATNEWFVAPGTIIRNRAGEGRAVKSKE